MLIFVWYSTYFFFALKLHNRLHCLNLQLLYFQEWLPNELSSILIEDFTSAKDLADHLHHLHRNDYEYLAYLRQKPSINDNRLSRISNDFLIQAMNLRSWGVSDKDQLTEGTYLQNHNVRWGEIICCNRILILVLFLCLWVFTKYFLFQ